MNEIERKENLVVYEALRNNILQHELKMIDIIIYMYVVYFALLTIALTWERILILLSFVMLIVFQSMLNEERWTIAKTSMYIQIFFENQRNDIHWESLHHNKRYQRYHAKHYKRISWFLERWASSLLAMISLVALVYSIFQSLIISVTVSKIVILALGVILTTLVLYTNKLFFTNIDNKELVRQLQGFYVNRDSSTINKNNVRRNEMF